MTDPEPPHLESTSGAKTFETASNPGLPTEIVMVPLFDADGTPLRDEDGRPVYAMTAQPKRL
jgi:hypothetical protein